MGPVVSMITVNYNQSQVTAELLHSVKKQDWIDFEMIVVDNGSDEDCGKSLSATFPWVKFVRSEKNLGFAGGNNLGISVAQGQFLFFVNNDIEIPTNTIGSLLSVLDQCPGVGAISPLIYYHDHPDKIQFAGYTDIHPLTGRNKAINQSSGSQLAQTPFVHGAAMMVRKEVVAATGGLPENYFLYYEELDWGIQIRELGFECYVDERSCVYHKESISTGKASPLKTYFQTRNRILFMRRNFDQWRQAVFFSYFFLIATPKNCFSYLRRGAWYHLESYLKGIVWNLTHSVESQEIGFEWNDLSK